jgi:hypothetical protein
MESIENYLGNKNIAIIARMRQLLIADLDWNEYNFYSKIMAFCTMSEFGLIDFIAKNCWRVRE